MLPAMKKVLLDFMYAIPSQSLVLIPLTAVVCGYIDVVGKSLLSKLKNNKKSSHIFIDIEPQYNQDIFNVRLMNTIRMSVFDILYSLVYTLFGVWRNYEKNGTN